MAVEADSVVVELIAQNAQFDAATKASATNFSKSMGDIQASGAAAEKGVGQFSSALKENRLQMNQSRVGMLEFQHIARGVSDQYAASGLSAQLLTSHIGELSEAIVLSGGSFGKLGAFLQGPWGIALTLATSAVAGLVSAHFAAKDAADKHRSAEETLTDFIHGEKIATDALIDSLVKLNDEENKSLETTNQSIRARYDLAHATIAQAEANKAILQTQLASAQAEAAAARSTELNSAGAPVYASTAAAGQAASTQARVDSIKQSIADLDTVIGQSTALIDTEFTKLARNLSTHVGRANDEFDRQLAALEAKYRGTEARRNGQNVLVGGAFNQPGITDAQRNKLLADLTAQEEKLGISRAKAVDAARKLDEAEQGVAKSTEQFGRQVSFADAEAIAAAAGLKVTSGYRSTAKQAELYRTVRTPENPVAKPGTSAHEGVNGKWALDIAFAPGLTPASIKKLYGDQGVSLSAIYKESGHYHIEGSRSQAAADENAAQRASEKAAREAAAAAQKAREQEAAFQSELDRLNGEFLSARKSQVKDQLAQLDISEDEVRAEQRKRDDGYQSAVSTGKLLQAQADQLKAVEAAVAAEKIKAIEIQKQIVLLQREDTAAERDAQYRIDNLKALEASATSQEQRRELDLQILDILYQEKEAHLRRLRQIALDNNDQGTANDLQAQIDQLGQQKANDVQSTLRGTMDPLHSWLQSVPHDALAVTEALQGIAVNGFDNLASSIAGVITGTESLGQAFGNIAKQIVGDIIQMTIKMLIFRALSSALGGIFGGGSLGALPGGDISFANPDPGSLFTNPAPLLPTLAGGGFGIIGGTGGTDNNLLSVNGQGVAWVSKGEGIAIVPNNAAAASSSNSQPSFIVVQVQANDYFDARVAEVSRPIAAAAGMRGAYGGAALARNGLVRRQIHQLGSRG